MYSEADQRIVHLIARMHFLTPEQVCRRYYSPTAITGVQTRLKRLTDSGVLMRRGWDRLLTGGTRPYVYSLAPKTRSQLIASGYLPQQRYRPSEDKATRLYPAHTLAVNDVLITAEGLQGGVRLDHFIHERTIQRMLIPYKPDAYLEFSNGKALLLEVDQDTEDAGFWQRKLERLVRFVNGDDYDRVFPRFHGVLIVGTDDKRTHRLRDWTETELDRMRIARHLFHYVTLEQARDATVFNYLL